MDEMLSKLLLELYRGSQRVDPSHFQEWVFDTVTKVLPNSGGSWVSGVQLGDVPPMHSYYLHRFPAEMIRDYVDIWQQDPLHHALEKSCGNTLHFRRDVDYTGCKPVLAYMDKYGVGEVLATRVVDPISRLRTVITVSRGVGEPSFTEAERRFMEYLMPHLIEIWTANRVAYALKQSDSGRQTAVATATAVVDSSATLHVTEDYFTELVRAEWKDWEGPRLPADLLPLIADDDAPAFVGEQVVIVRIGTIRDQTLLRIRRKGSYDRLGEREQQIARLVSEGLSQKEVARQCGISPATVNNHIAKIYLKLGIGDKAQLAKVLALFE